MLMIVCLSLRMRQINYYPIRVEINEDSQQSTVNSFYVIQNNFRITSQRGMVSLLLPVLMRNTGAFVFWEQIPL